MPIFDGTVWQAVELGGHFLRGSGTDHWGTVWQSELTDMAPVDVGHPLADIRLLDSYKFPDPARLTWTEKDQARLDSIDRNKFLVGGLHVRFICERLCCLMGIENFMTALYETSRILSESGYKRSVRQ